MNTLIINNHSSFIGKLKKLVLEQEFGVDVVDFNIIYPNQIKNYDFIILSGGSQLNVTGHDQDFAAELELVRTTQKPLLGICLGFELIAHAYNAQLLRMETKEKGIIKIEKLTEDPIFNNLDNIEVFESHRWVIKDISKELIGLAKSNDGIEIIKHRDKLIYGFQFHPEMFPEKTQGDEIFINFIKLITDENKH